MGVATGCGCNEVYYIDFLILLNPLLLYLFFSVASLFSFLKMFFVLVAVLFCNYILCI